MTTSRAGDLKACLGVGKSFDSGWEDGYHGQAARQARASIHCPLTGIGKHLLISRPFDAAALGAALLWADGVVDGTRWRSHGSGERGLESGRDRLDSRTWPRALGRPIDPAAAV